MDEKESIKLPIMELAQQGVDLALRELWLAYNHLMKVGGEEALTEEDADMWAKVTSQKRVQKLFEIEKKDGK